MAYDPYARSSDTWDYRAQVALWRERAIHQSQRAAYYKSLVEAAKNGTTLEKTKENA